MSSMTATLFSKQNVYSLCRSSSKWVKHRPAQGDIDFNTYWRKDGQMARLLAIGHRLPKWACTRNLLKVVLSAKRDTKPNVAGKTNKRAKTTRIIFNQLILFFAAKWEKNRHVSSIQRKREKNFVQENEKICRFKNRALFTKTSI